MLDEIDDFCDIIKDITLEKFPNGIPPALMSILTNNINEFEKKSSESSESSGSFELSESILRYDEDEELITVRLGGNDQEVPKQFVKIIKYMRKLQIYDIFISRKKSTSDIIFIAFSSNYDFERFMDIVFMDLSLDDNSEMYYRALDRTMPDNWKYSICLRRYFKTYKDNEYKINDVEPVTTINFPYADYEWVFKRIKKFYDSGREYGKVLLRKYSDINKDNDDIYNYTV